MKTSRMTHLLLLRKSAGHLDSPMHPCGSPMDAGHACSPMRVIWTHPYGSNFHGLQGMRQAPMRGVVDEALLDDTAVFAFHTLQSVILVVCNRPVISVSLASENSFMRPTPPLGCFPASVTRVLHPALRTVVWGRRMPYLKVCRVPN